MLTSGGSSPPLAAAPPRSNGGGGADSAALQWLLSFRLSDVLFLLLGCCALLVTLRSATDYELRVAWSGAPVRLAGTEAETGNSGGAGQWRPPPLVADVDGDGRNGPPLSGHALRSVASSFSSPPHAAAPLCPSAVWSGAEVVVVGPDLVSVRVLGASGGSRSGSSFSALSSGAPSLSELWSVRAPASAALPFVDRIVHVESGYIDPYDAQRQRTQVLVAVTAAKEVLCFDTRTRQLLWSRRAGTQAGESAEEEEVAAESEGGAADAAVVVDASDVSVLINPHPMRVNDSGVVVVGVRVRGSGHFSHFAFSGRSGALRWRHDAADFVAAASRSVSSARLVHEQHDVHTGEVEWRNFRAAFLAALPHRWASARDTRLDLVQVSPPQRQGALGTAQAERAAASSSRRAAASISAALPMSALSVAASARWAHDDAEHLPHPNAIMAHTREGLELLSFYTGRPLAHLALQSGPLHADLNGDGVVDHVHLVQGAAAAGGADDAAASSWMSPFAPCTAVVSSGIPPSSPLFNVSGLCSGGFERLLARGWALGAHGIRAQGAAAVPSVVGGIPVTQSLQGRRHLRLAGQSRVAGSGPRRRSPRSRNPNPLVPAAETVGDGSTQSAEDGTEEEADEVEGEGEQQPGSPAADSRDISGAESEWVAAPLLLPPAVASAGISAPSSAALVSYFLSSTGLLTAVDGRGRKLFSTRTRASTRGSAAPAHQRLLRYDVKTDHSMVSRTSPTAARSALCLTLSAPRSAPAVCTHSPTLRGAS